MMANTKSRAPGRTVATAPYRSKRGPAKKPVKKVRKVCREPIQAILEEDKAEWEEDEWRGGKGEVR